MKVKQVLKRHHKLVPFPLTTAKIEAAGYNVTQYLTDLIKELNRCEDSNDLLVRQLKEQTLDISPL